MKYNVLAELNHVYRYTEEVKFTVEADSYKDAERLALHKLSNMEGDCCSATYDGDYEYYNIELADESEVPTERCPHTIDMFEP